MPVLLRKPQLLVLLALLTIFGSCSREASNSVSGTVVKIVDGDTITILDAHKAQHKIRLQGIDSPERKQDFYQVSKEHLASLVWGKHVIVIFNPDNKYDRWRRIIGKVLIDGKDECLEQIKAGLAWHFKKYEKEQPLPDQQKYASAEREARLQKRGLWQDPNPIPPWDFRPTNGSSVETDSRGEPVSSGDNFINSAPSPDLSSTDAPTPVVPSSLYASAPNSIRGNRRTKIYHWLGCPNYDDIAPRNRVPFASREEAERAGYRAARNCN